MTDSSVAVKGTRYQNLALVHAFIFSRFLLNDYEIIIIVEILRDGHTNEIKSHTYEFKSK